MKQETQEKPEVKLIGEDGNAFSIMARCQRAWKDAGNNMDKWEKIQKEMMSGDYDHLLHVATQYFDVY